jgi:hypothetical protein
LLCHEPRCSLFLGNARGSRRGNSGCRLCDGRFRHSARGRQDPRRSALGNGELVDQCLIHRSLIHRGLVRHGWDLECCLSVGNTRSLGRVRVRVRRLGTSILRRLRCDGNAVGGSALRARGGAGSGERIVLELGNLLRWQRRCDCVWSAEFGERRAHGAVQFEGTQRWIGRRLRRWQEWEESHLRSCRSQQPRLACGRRLNRSVQGRWSEHSTRQEWIGTHGQRD